MDELTLLKDMANDTPLLGEADLAPARATLVTSIAQPSRGRRRLWVSGVAVVGLAAAITAVVSFGVLEPVGIAPAPASAEEILREAAQAARALPATPPRPDQFVYTRTEYAGGAAREAWLSADGTRDGQVKQYNATLLIPGCRDGRTPVRDKEDRPLPGQFEQCEPSPAYQPNLPTDAAGMREYLNAMPGSKDSANSLGKNIYELVAEGYVHPAALAALFEAVAELDGLEVVADAKDGAGRPGVGVRWTHVDSAVMLVFDTETYAFLGMPEAGAVVEQAAVDNPGQKP
ncbi:CU044_5270 family protein [Actinophytocola sediminis]